MGEFQTRRGCGMPAGRATVTQYGSLDWRNHGAARESSQGPFDRNTRPPVRNAGTTISVNPSRCWYGSSVASSPGDSYCTSEKAAGNTQLNREQLVRVIQHRDQHSTSVRIPERGGHDGDSVPDVDGPTRRAEHLADFQRELVRIGDAVAHFDDAPVPHLVGDAFLGRQERRQGRPWTRGGRLRTGQPWSRPVRRFHPCAQMRPAPGTEPRWADRARSPRSRAAAAADKPTGAISWNGRLWRESRFITSNHATGSAVATPMFAVGAYRDGSSHE